MRPLDTQEIIWVSRSSLDSNITTLHIKLAPKASANRVVVEAIDADMMYLKIYVTAVPENGRANEAMIALLAKHFRKPKVCFELIRGHKSQHKVVKVHALV